ncbi:MAG: DUF6882 domain-containing protein [Methanobacteriaceae archaeon]
MKTKENKRIKRKDKIKEIIIEDEISKGESFLSLLNKFGPYALYKQENLASFIGDDEGELDIENGKIIFESFEAPIQILGFNNGKEWIWAWDNDDIGFPDDLIQDVKKIHEIGQKYDIIDFTDNSIDIGLDESHYLAMVATMILDSDAYYIAKYGNFDLFVSIKSDEIPADTSLDGFVKPFQNFATSFFGHDVIKHRKAFEYYTLLHKYHFKERDNFSVAKIGQARVIVGFTENGNINNIQTLKE